MDTAADLDISLLPIGPRRLKGRARADLRWIGAHYSTRCRLGLEARPRACTFSVVAKDYY